MLSKKLEVKSKKKFLVFSFFLFTLYFVTPIFAADSTPSADPLRQSASEASIKTKLEELKKEIASKAAKLKVEVNRKLNNKAYVGNIKTRSLNSLTLASSGGPKLVILNQDTVFESKVKTKVKFSQKSLSEEDYIAALGDVDETQVLTAKKIILLPQSKPSTKTYLWGKIVSKEARLATLLGRDQKNVAVSIPKDVKVKLSDFIIATGTKNENDIFEAQFVYVIPQGGILKPKKVVYPAPDGAGASPSAQAATASAKPKSSTR